MKKIIIALSLIILIGCKAKKIEYEHEGCEYLLIIEHGAQLGLAHKGNCNNPIHKK